MKKTIIYFALLFSLINIISCGGEYKGDCLGSNCSKTGITYFAFPFDTKDNNWLGAFWYEKIFVYSNGVDKEISYSSYNTRIDADLKTLRTYNIYNNNSCCPSYAVNDVVQYLIQKNTINPTNDSIQHYFEFNRKKGFLSKPIVKDSFEISDTIDNFYIQVYTKNPDDKRYYYYDHVFKLIFDTLTNTTTNRYYSEIKLRNNTYYDVFETIDLNARSNAVQGIYFSKSRGIVGFYKSNNNLWVLR